MNRDVSLCSLLEEFLVEQKYEQVDVDLGFVEHFHHSHAVVLKLQQILKKKSRLY